MGVRPAGAPADAKLSLKERAHATMDAGYRAFRMGAGDVPIGDAFDTRSAVRRIARDCKEVREGVGPDGDWCIDFHQRFDLNDALRLCRAIEEFEPFFVEDPVRDEHALQDIPKLRQLTKVPLTHGEEWGLKWAAICETHAVGIVPHVTGPIATAALVHCLSTFSGPVMLEYNYGGRPIDCLPECLDFMSGKAYTNQRSGLGATLDMKRLTQIGEVTEPGRRNVFHRPDGSLTHW